MAKRKESDKPRDKALLGKLLDEHLKGDWLSVENFDGFLYSLTRAGYKTSDWDEATWSAVLEDHGEDDAEGFMLALASW